MNEDVLERIFPHPPWPVRAGYVGRRAAIGALLLALGFLIALYYARSAAADLRQLRQDAELWSGAEAAANVVEVPATAKVGGSNTKGLLYTNHVDVTFEVDGVARERSLSAQTAFGELEGREPARVRFDAQAPERWALNWAASAYGNRLGTLTFMGLAGVLLVGGSIAFLGWALWVGADRARRVALRGISVACEVSEVVEQKSYGRSTGAFTYRFRMPAQYGGKRREAVFRGKQPRPLLLLGGRYLVACILPKDPDVFVVPAEDFAPFAFSEEVERGIRERILGIR